MEFPPSASKGSPTALNVLPLASRPSIGGSRAEGTASGVPSLPPEGQAAGGDERHRARRNRQGGGLNPPIRACGPSHPRERGADDADGQGSDALSRSRLRCDGNDGRRRWPSCSGLAFARCSDGWRGRRAVLSSASTTLRWSVPRSSPKAAREPRDDAGRPGPAAAARSASARASSAGPEAASGARGDALAGGRDRLRRGRRAERGPARGSRDGGRGLRARTSWDTP